MSYLKEQLAEANLQGMTKGAIWRLLKATQKALEEAEAALEFKDRTNKALQDRIQRQV